MYSDQNKNVHFCIVNKTCFQMRLYDDIDETLMISYSTTSLAILEPNTCSKQGMTDVNPPVVEYNFVLLKR